MAEYNSIQRLEDHLGSTHNSLSSLEEAHEEVSLGAKRNGRMSVVRRFFCLFVLFDLLLISLIWLLCLMLMGSDKIMDILKMQVLHYNITTSIFDIVLAAFCRFTVLLLFYGLLQVNTTLFVALTTLATCMFLIVKVIYYSWNTASQPVFQVIPVLISFVIAWAEAWFLDFRVLPQELSALTYVQATSHFSDSLSTLLLNRNLRSPVMRHFLENMASQIGAPTESNGNFYSPVESTNVSTDDSEDFRTEKEKRNDQCLMSEAAYPNQLSNKSFTKLDKSHNYFKKNLPSDLRSDEINNEYLRRGKDALEVAWSLLNDCDWKIQKTSPEGDSVYCKYEAHLGKVFLLRAKINICAQRLLEELFTNIDKLTLWNKTVIESKRLLMIDKQTDITYQVSSPAANGVISSRDFVNLRHWDIRGDCFVLAGISVPYPDLPPCKSYIRAENGPCCWVMRSSGEKYDSCSFEFLLNTNLKGWIPQYALDAALTSVLLEYSSCLREYCKTIRISSESIALNHSVCSPEIFAYCKNMDDSKGKLLSGNICCLGVSYVGVPVSTVIAYMCPSLKVAVVDMNPDKITLWNTKQIPTREPGLEEMLKKCQNRNLVFTADTEGAIKAADIIFVSMITTINSYSCEEEILDFVDIERAATFIAKTSESSKIIVQKTTVPSGSNEIIRRVLDANKGKDINFQILTIPEFFSAGNAVNDLLNPDRVLIGSDETKEALEAVNTIVSIYSQWVPREKIITMSNSSAELAKLSTNAFLAQKLSSVSAMSILCERSGADVTEVINVLGKCSAIGSEYLEPSISLGGTHLKNDLFCLVFLCEHLNLIEAAAYWKEVLLINEYQQKRFKKKIFSSFLNTLTHKKIAIWGVALKRNVEIAKDSPAVDICHSLLSEGAKLRVYDPKVEKRQLMDEFTLLGVKNSEKSITYYDDPYKAANKAHAIVVCTDWEEFSNINYSLIYKDMLRPAYIFDGRKCLPHEELRKIGFIVRTIGKEFEQTCERETFQFV